MRVALFFDGKNFYSGWREAARGKRIDFSKLANWLVKKVGGSILWGAHYYTGVDDVQVLQPEAQQKLNGFLDMLETQPGFFVSTFKRRIGTISCSQCGADNKYTLEKEVDTTMVANMLKMAASDSFDIMVLLSGDADYVPAIEGVRSLGKQAYIASWGGTGVSKRIRSVTFAHIDMLQGLEEFEREGSEDDILPFIDEVEQPLEIASVTGDEPMDAFLAELEQAEDKFNGGYVGLGYFLTRWRSVYLDSTPETRRMVLDKLLTEGYVETYNAPDGALAIRVSKDPMSKTKIQDEQPLSSDISSLHL